MMKWLFVAFALLLASPASAQSTVCATPGGKAYVQTAGCAQVGSGGFTPSCTAASNFLARATGITLTADKTNYDTLICGLVTDGVFAKLDAMWVVVAPDSATQLLNLVSSSFPLTAHNYSFVAKTPITGDTTSLYFQTAFTPSSSGTNYTLNSASFGACHTNTRSTGQNYASMGISDTNHSDRLIPNFNGTLFIGAVNGAQFNPSITPTLPGLWAEDRSGATTTDVYKNGVSQNTDTTGSNAFSTSEFYLFAENSAPNTPINFTGDTIAMEFISGSLGATLQGNLRSRINTFLSAYSVSGC